MQLETKHVRRFFVGWLSIAISAALIMAGGLTGEPQNWAKKIFGRITFEVPPDWKAMSMDANEQVAWYTGSEEDPDALFSAIETDDIGEILGMLTVETKRATTVGGKSAVMHIGKSRDEGQYGLVIVFDEKGPGGKTFALIGAFLDEPARQKYQGVVDRIVHSVRFAGAAPAASCWESFTFDPRQFAAQPGGVFPMRPQYRTGRYLVRIGPAGKSGLDLPPARTRTFGPYDLTAGNKYAAIIKKGLGTVCEMEWLTNGARLMMYSNPPKDGAAVGLPGHAVVYVRNEITDEFYAVCLEAVGTAPAGKPELHFDAGVLQTIKAGQTYTLTAKATGIPPGVTTLKFGWYLHLNDCLSATPAGAKVNFWYNQMVPVRDGVAECSLVVRAAAQKGDSSFSLIVQDEPYTKRVFLNTGTLSYKIQ
jgi:hypothetical protein